MVVIRLTLVHVFVECFSSFFVFTEVVSPSQSGGSGFGSADGVPCVCVCVCLFCFLSGSLSLPVSVSYIMHTCPPPLPRHVLFDV